MGKFLLRCFLRGMALLLALLIIVAGFYWFSTDLPSPEHLRARAALGNTRMLDRYGRLIYELPDPFSGTQHPLPLAQMPLALQQATIAVEDRSFYNNSGIDGRGILRAAWDNLVQGSIVAGGSTITQQLARNFLLDPHLSHQRTLDRKLREVVLALKLTAHFSKDEILSLYLNQTYYGGMSYGVEAAAQHYFAKPARELDLAECAFLAGLPQAPSTYDPFTNDAAAQERQHMVLEAMVQEGYITPQQAEAASAEPLQFAAHEPRKQAPHFVFFVLRVLTEQFGPDTVTRGGLTITTTLDLDIQNAAQETLQRHIALLAQPRNGKPDHHVGSGAVVVLDPSTGEILAMVGSPDFSNTANQGQVNGALAPRQPGSAIKPLTYAAALERGWTPSTIIPDVSVSFPTREGQPYTPENYDGHYHGTLSLREALATSSNVAAVYVLHEIGMPALLDMASRLGISTLRENSGRYGLALTLGGGEVTLLELTAAYGVFARGGEPVVPVAVLAVRGAGQGTPWKNTHQPHQQVISPQVAYLISDILSDRYARMRTFGLSSVLNVDRPAAVKTGTTTDWRDNWTIGYTPDRVVGVWVGNADGRPMESISGVDGAGPVWHDVMLVAHHGLPPRPFARPDGMVERVVCAETGLLPTPSCTSTRLERFVAGTQPQGVGQVAQGTDRGTTHGEQAPIITPLDQDQARAGVAPPQPAPLLLAPADGAVFALSPGVPSERQQIMLRAAASNDTTRLRFIVDGTLVATCSGPPWQTFWPLAPGTHEVWVEAQEGQGTTRRSKIVVFQVETRKE